MNYKICTFKSRLGWCCDRSRNITGSNFIIFRNNFATATHYASNPTWLKRLGVMS